MKTMNAESFIPILCVHQPKLVTNACDFDEIFCQQKLTLNMKTICLCHTVDSLVILAKEIEFNKR